MSEGLQVSYNEIGRSEPWIRIAVRSKLCFPASCGPPITKQHGRGIHMLHPHPKEPNPDPRTIRNRARLSVTADDLPRGTDYVLRRVHRNTHPAWYLVVIRNGIEYDRLAHSYAQDPYMAWARARIFNPLGVIDPAVDLEAYHRSRWWGLDWPLTARTLVTLEEAAAGYVTPWNHDWLTSPA